MKFTLQKDTTFLFASDHLMEPHPVESSIEDGILYVGSEFSPIAITVQYEVDDFGRVALQTLPLSERDEPYQLEHELLKARIHHLKLKCHEYKHKPEKIERLFRAFDSGTASLSQTLWLSERFVLEVAERDIRRRTKGDGFRNFKLGANLYGFHLGGAYLQLFKELFNYATLPFYWKSFEPEPGKCDRERLDAMAQWCLDNRIVTKGHPLVWFDKNAYPQWAIRQYDEVKSLLRKRITQIVRTYSGRIDIWDVINEAHDCANCLNYTHEQLLDVTRFACDVARSANPSSTLVVNCTDPWGYNSSLSRNSHSTLLYCREVVENGFDFDLIGLQFYLGVSSLSRTCRDLFEFSRILDSYGTLGKSIHLTEAGVPSAMPDNRPDKAGWWHSPWNEETQADWIEGYYKVALSKPFISAVTWWDFADYQSHFLPHSGFLREDLSPKPSFYRLKELTERTVCAGR